jgi:hypothetical protein
MIVIAVNTTFHTFTTIQMISKCIGMTLNLTSTKYKHNSFTNWWF